MAGCGVVESWLRGLAEMGCTFLELLPDEKRTHRDWHHYAAQTGSRGLSSAGRWLSNGSGVGILPRAPLWVLDADSTNEVERIVSTCLDAQIIPLMVGTPSGGAHFYFVFPSDFPMAGLKHHLCHPRNEDGERLKVDFKLGPRTLLVAPGTMRKGKTYAPATDWRQPPVVDPRMFLPFGKFWRETHPFLVDTRPLKDRISRACYYLNHRAPVSISGASGHKVLAGVTAHLVQYLNLDPELAFHLLTNGPQPWNQRCRDKAEKPHPWPQRELWRGCCDAVNLVPRAGVLALNRLNAKARTDSYLELLKNSITLPGEQRMPVERVIRLFGWFGIPDLKAKGFGEAITKNGIIRVRATHRRIQCLPGLDYRALVGAILLLKVSERFPEGGKAGCALMKHRSALPNSPIPVEQIASTNLEVA